MLLSIMISTMKVGIVGFPGSGRQTLFNLLTHTERVATAQAAQLGVLKIPDGRLEELARLT